VERVSTIAPRLEGLPVRTVLGREVPVALTSLSRLLGLAWLDRERAGTGLLIPWCRSIHTFGMRFPLEVVFLDGEYRPLGRRSAVGPGRFLFDRRADSILELVWGRGDKGERLREAPPWLSSGMRARGIALSLVAERVDFGPGFREGLPGLVDAIRGRAEEALGFGIPAPQAALARGFVLGQDQSIGPDAIGEFRHSGLAHLLRSFQVGGTTGWPIRRVFEVHPSTGN